MTSAQMLLLLLPGAYIAGSVPFGLIVGLSRGIDVRKAGSGNIGATNVGRLLGGKFFALVFLLDLLKGLGPMIAGGVVLGFSAADATAYLLWLAIGLAAILGHMFSIFLGFKGGKGVATSAGVVLGLVPYFTLPGLVALLIWTAFFLRTKMVSLASIIAAGVFPIAYIGLAVTLNWHPFDAQLPLLCFSLLVGGLIIFRHRTNIARLRAGTEHRFGRAAKQAGGNGDRLAGTNGDHNDPSAPDRR